MGILNRGVEHNLLIKHKYKVKLTDEVKRKLSVSRTNYLKKHPESHPWRNKDKFISPPCEYLKTKLRNNGISFVEEYQPFLDIGRFYYCKCGNTKLKNSKTCNECHSMNQRKVQRPDIDVLLTEINESNYSAVGRKYGVSDNTIRKWIKKK